MKQTKKTTPEQMKNAYDGRFNEISAAVIIAQPPNGKIVSVNLEAEELTGYEATELKKMRFSDIFADENQDRVKSLFAASKLESKSFRKLFEHNVIIRKRSKRQVIVDMGFHLSQVKEKSFYIFTLQDITDLKSTEMQVRQANEYVSSILSSMNESLFVIDSSHRIKTVNSSALQLLGYSEDELLEQNIESVFESTAEFPLDKVLTKNSARFEAKFSSKSNALVPVLVSVSCLQTAKNEGALYVLVAMDLTARKKAESLIAEQQMMLVQATKMSSLGVMASGIAHEINNPLHVINGHCELLNIVLETKPDDTKSIREAIDVISKMAQRVDDIVKGLKSFSRDERQAPFEVAPVSAILHETLLLCERRIRNAGIELVLPPTEKEFEIQCRPTQISQIILNLLNNAYDAIEAEKTRGETHYIKIAFEVVDDFIDFTVENSGEKIDSSISEQIFQPFFTTKNVGKGTGLGLSISKSIVEDHGGQIYLDERCPHTKFVVRLPNFKANFKEKSKSLRSAS